VKKNLINTLVVLASFAALVFLVLRTTSDTNQDRGSSQEHPEDLSTTASSSSGRLDRSVQPALDADLAGSPSALNDPQQAARLKGATAFVRSEDLAKEFGLMVRRRAQLEARMKKSEQEWEGEAARFKKELEDFQRRAASMGDGQRRSMEQTLANKEQNLMKMREQMVAELSEAEAAADRELRSLLDREFQKYSRARGLKFLMAKQVGSGLLYGDSSLDLTADLLLYLNSKYR